MEQGCSGKRKGEARTSRISVMVPPSSRAAHAGGSHPPTSSSLVVTRHSLGSIDASSPAVSRAVVLQAQKRRLGGLRLGTTRALERQRRRRRVLCDDVTTICHYSAEILPLFAPILTLTLPIFYHNSATAPYISAGSITQFYRSIHTVLPPFHPRSSPSAAILS